MSAAATITFTKIGYAAPVYLANQRVDEFVDIEFSLSSWYYIF